ncbi:MAG: hypothetical protein ABIJ26_08380 [Candidatus Margulisiibacteriota bacterium]|nr:hypothetical protein [Candidatus Margulisiibacteriota bacterium]
MKIVLVSLALVLLLSLSASAALETNAGTAEKLMLESSRFTFGLGMAGNPFLGVVTKNGFGYPVSEAGLSNWLGFSYTWISGQPTQAEIEEAVKTIVAKYGDRVFLPQELATEVRSLINKNQLTYFTFGTVGLIFPLNIEGGWMWLASDNIRFRFGLGLPLLVAFGINFDF